MPSRWFMQKIKKYSHFCCYFFVCVAGLANTSHCFQPYNQLLQKSMDTSMLLRNLGFISYDNECGSYTEELSPTWCPSNVLESDSHHSHPLGNYAFSGYWRALGWKQGCMQIRRSMHSFEVVVFCFSDTSITICFQSGYAKQCSLFCFMSLPLSPLVSQ